MGIFDFLSPNTTAATDAATQAAIGNIGQTVSNNFGILNGTTNQASHALTQGTNKAEGQIQSGYGAGIGAVTGYGQQAQGAIGDAVKTAQSGNSNFQPYATSGTAANGMLSNALGLNGTAGNATATAAFQGSPGYQYQVDQATGAAQRAAAAGGMNASGNTLQAVAQLGSNLANQNFQTWINNLQNQGSQGLQAASGISSANQGAANLQGTGAQLLQNTGSSLGTLNSSEGSALGSLTSQNAVNQANLKTNLGTALTGNNWTGTNDMTNVSLADAKAQDSASSLNNGILSNLFLKGAGSIGGALSSATGFL